MKLALISENTLIIYLGDRIDPQVNAQVVQAQRLLREHFSPLIIDLVPAYASLLVTFDVLQIYGEQLQFQIERLLTERLSQTAQALTQQSKQSTEKTRVTSDEPTLNTSDLHRVPVYYASDVGLDLLGVAKQTGLSVSEVVHLHTAPIYRVYAIGFSPGFAFLGSLEQRLSLPRKATPRQQVPAGSVAIAERQTGVYPSESPGGWHVLGRTLVWPELSVGDQVQFYAIDRDQFLAAGGVIANVDVDHV